MIPLIFRPIDQWPDGWRDPERERRYSQFKLGYTQTRAMLDKELRMIDAQQVVLQLDASPGQVRLDGQLRADAKVTHPGVILTVDTAKLGTLVYPCDTFQGRWSSTPDWHVNLLAITKGLEALRMLDRYGIVSAGQQYAGFNALGSGVAMGEAETMDVLRATRVLSEAADLEATPSVEWARAHADDLYRTAAKRYHPDSGHALADASVFGRITLARDVLKGAA